MSAWDLPCDGVGGQFLFLFGYIHMCFYFTPSLPLAGPQQPYGEKGGTVAVGSSRRMKSSGSSWVGHPSPSRSSFLAVPPFLQRHGVGGWGLV